MKYLPIYDELFGCKNEDEVFNYLIDNLKPLTINWDFFTNWEKVFKDIRPLEIGLNTLNYLIGKENFDEEFKYLVKKQPELLSLFPYLLVRNGLHSNAYNILINEENYKFKIFDFSKLNPTEKDINDYLYLIDKTGLKELFINKKIKNLSDYIIGIEAGLNTHSRKNSG